MTKDEFDRRWNAIMRELEGNRMLSPEALQAATGAHTEQHLRSAEKALAEKDREIEFLKTVINERDQALETMRADKQFCESNFDQMRSTIQDLRTENRHLRAANAQLASDKVDMDKEVKGCVDSAMAYKKKAEQLENENRELKNKIKALEAAHELDMKRLANAWQRSPLVESDERKAAVENLKRRVDNTIRNVTAELEKPVENETPEQKELREFIASVGRLIEGMR